MRAPNIVAVPVDWAAAFEELKFNEELRAVSLKSPMRARANRAVPVAVARLNDATTHRFPNIAQSPVPVLLPFDTEAYLRDRADRSADGDSFDEGRAYLSGFHARSFFFAGPAGYDAAFALRASEVPEFSGISFAEPIEIHISGSALVYELEDQRTVTGSPYAPLEAEFPGIRRMIYEHHLRFTFERYGVPYTVSVPCLDSAVPRYRLATCRAAERIATRFLRALQIAGGTPQPARAQQPLAIERPGESSQVFRYHPPGRLLPGTGLRGESGRPDRTVYSQIRFPLLAAPAYANSQMFAARNKSTEPGVSANYSYPWRDNFCERRGFPVGQCPAGAGHQGQDLRPAPCQPSNGPCPPHDVVAVRDGAIYRAARQEALYLVVNTAREHIRFRYLHMDPRKLDAADMLSGRIVNEGDTLGQVSNFHRREGGTSYHLHFDVQVPTRSGWVFVSPYMTLVGAYERLIGGRGEEVRAETQVTAVGPVTHEPGSALARPASPKPDVTPLTSKLDSPIATIMTPEPGMEKRKPPRKRHNVAKHKKQGKAAKYSKASNKAKRAAKRKSHNRSRVARH